MMCSVWLIVFCARCATSMRNICARFSPNARYMSKIRARLYFFPQCAIYAQDLRKIVLISPMRSICARFAQDCTSFSNAEYMRKICARLYLFPQCAIYAQDLRKIVPLSTICNICTRLQALLEEICHISHICSKFRMVSLHSYFWIATSFDFFLNKHL